VIGAKEKNVHMLSAKLDDEQSLVAKAQKNIKELQARVDKYRKVAGALGDAGAAADAAEQEAAMRKARARSASLA